LTCFINRPESGFTQGKISEIFLISDGKSLPSRGGASLIKILSQASCRLAQIPGLIFIGWRPW
jgi:hypothetical protein